MGPTPLQPREFFDGRWIFDRELRYRGLLGYLRPPERFRYTAPGQWVSDRRKEFEDRLEFESGRVLQSRFTAEIVGEDRLHVTCEAMPGGADILLSERGYTYTPYLWLVRMGPFTIRLRCRDTNVVDEKGVIHDRAEMSWLGLPPLR
jgi:hypothetical protein